MNTQFQSQTGTRAIARVLGPYLVISMAVHLLRRDDVPAMLAGLESNAVVPWVSGAFALLVGLAFIGVNQEWRSAPGIVIGAIGVVTTLEGIVLMAVPDAYGSIADTVPFVAAAVLMGLVGLYLTYVGWVRGD